MKVFAFLVVLLAAVVFVYQTKAPHILRKQKASTQSHFLHVFNELWDESEIDSLLQVVRESKFSITTNAATQSINEDIGEAEPVASDGSCPRLKTKTKNGTVCILPERFDVALHQIISGGIDSRKESYATAVARMLVFQKYFHSVEGNTELPAVHSLFTSEKYLTRAAKVCGPGKTHLEPMTLAVLLYLPGQMVPMHLDLPWFFGANRYIFPGWLLVVMQASGLFAESRIPQVQGVAYLHRWTDVSYRRGGFFFYPNGTAHPPEVVPAKHNTALICDGTEMIHGTETYVEQQAPPLTKDNAWTMEFDSTSTASEPVWILLKDGVPFKRYNESELRITLVWRQHCFADVAERDRWQAELQDTSKMMQLDDVLNKLERELIARKRITARPDPMTFAQLLVDEFIAYPFPDSPFPYNPCALEALAPDYTRPLFATFCSGSFSYVNFAY